MQNLSRIRSDRARAAAPKPVPSRCRSVRGQSGVVLIYALIAVMLLMISGMALVKGMGTSLAVGGNFALRRDLINQGEEGVANAKALFATGGLLASALSRQTSSTAANYSATTLANSNASDYNGIPMALLNDTTFAGVGSSANDITGTFGISIRYVIDRQCTTTGKPNSAACMTFSSACKAGTAGCSGNVQLSQGAGTISKPVYRITVRITGPMNSMAFIQTTVEA
jgi:hypothetical protein